MDELLKSQKSTSDLWLMYEYEKKKLLEMSNEEYQRAVKAIADKYGI